MSATDPDSHENSAVQLDEFVSEDRGFTRIDWDRFWTALDAASAGPESDWEDAKFQWCERLRDDLGGDARLYIAGNVLLLTDMPADLAEGCLNYTDEVHGLLRLAFNDLGHAHARGRVPILTFSDDGDYYDYLSFHYPDEGTFPTSIGVQIRDGCPHIAIHSPEGRSCALTIAHELCHLLLSHLPVPLWVDEGVAMKLPRSLAASRASGSSAWWNALAQLHGPLIVEDTFERLQMFWDESAIQSFWAGTSFGEPGEPSQLSYTLAEILVTKLSEDWNSFVGFLGAAHFNDGGQTAALDHLGFCLGDAVAAYLNEGSFRPVRKELVRCWNERSSNEANA